MLVAMSRGEDCVKRILALKALSKIEQLTTNRLHNREAGRETSSVKLGDKK